MKQDQKDQKPEVKPEVKKEEPSFLGNLAGLFWTQEPEKPRPKIRKPTNFVENTKSGFDLFAQAEEEQKIKKQQEEEFERQEIERKKQERKNRMTNPINFEHIQGVKLDQTVSGEEGTKKKEAEVVLKTLLTNPEAKKKTEEFHEEQEAKSKKEQKEIEREREERFKKIQEKNDRKAELLKTLPCERVLTDLEIQDVTELLKPVQKILGRLLTGQYKQNEVTQTSLDLLAIIEQLSSKEHFSEEPDKLPLREYLLDTEKVRAAFLQMAMQKEIEKQEETKQETLFEKTKKEKKIEKEKEWQKLGVRQESLKKTLEELHVEKHKQLDQIMHGSLADNDSGYTSLIERIKTLTLNLQRMQTSYKNLETEIILIELENRKVTIKNKQGDGQKNFKILNERLALGGKVSIPVGALEVLLKEYQQAEEKKKTQNVALSKAEIPKEDISTEEPMFKGFGHK